MNVTGGKPYCHNAPTYFFILANIVTKRRCFGKTPPNLLNLSGIANILKSILKQFPYNSFVRHSESPMMPRQYLFGFRKVTDIGNIFEMFIAGKNYR
jgi:hypothetical protein